MAQAGISSSGIPPACEPTGGSQQEDIREGTATHIRALGLTREKAAELQGYIRRLLDGRGDASKPCSNCHIDEVLLERYRDELSGAPESVVRSAFRSFVYAVNMNIDLPACVSTDQSSSVPSFSGIFKEQDMSSFPGLNPEEGSGTPISTRPGDESHTVHPSVYIRETPRLSEDNLSIRTPTPMPSMRRPSNQSSFDLTNPLFKEVLYERSQMMPDPLFASGRQQQEQTPSPNSVIPRGNHHHQQQQQQQQQQQPQAGNSAPQTASPAPRRHSVPDHGTQGPEQQPDTAAPRRAITYPSHSQNIQKTPRLAMPLNNEHPSIQRQPRPRTALVADENSNNTTKANDIPPNTSPPPHPAQRTSDTTIRNLCEATLLEREETHYFHVTVTTTPQTQTDTASNSPLSPKTPRTRTRTHQVTVQPIPSPLLPPPPPPPPPRTTLKRPATSRPEFQRAPPPPLSHLATPPSNLQPAAQILQEHRARRRSRQVAIIEDNKEDIAIRGGGGSTGTETSYPTSSSSSSSSSLSSTNRARAQRLADRARSEDRLRKGERGGLLGSILCFAKLR